MFYDKAHLLKKLKMDLGIYSITLPVSDIELYQDVIVDKTIPEFSIYWSDDSNLISNEYLIPDIFPKQRILGINNIKPYIEYNGMTMTSNYETIDSYQVLATGQTLANLSSAMIPPQTFKFFPPNTFKIYNQVLYNNKVYIDITYTHSPELFTIPDTARSSFYKLALLDAKMYLWNHLRYFTTIQTAYGQMELKVDSWENAESERADLLSERADLLNNWDENYHLDSVPAIWYI